MGKKITVGSLVNQVVETAGVSKQNAVNIVNIFTTAWVSHRTDFLKAIDVGVPVKRSTAKKATAKKVTAKKATTKKVTTAKKNTEPATSVPEVKVQKKLKKKLKASKTEPAGDSKE